MSAKRERPRRKLPTGIQTFREIREDDCYYVDKTAFIRRLVDEGKHYFLSRPRRFGKSLFLDTLKELFEGSEALFQGLDVHGSWDWSVRHPVVRLDFSSGHFGEPGYVHTNLMTQLSAIEQRTGVGSDHATAPERFRHLIAALRERAGQRVVVLVDEYDKPILDALEKPEVARANRDYLRGLYSTIKFADAHIKFTLLTGVSKFSKVSLFSDLNNLVDITLEPEYSTLCGYTDADLDEVFAPELPGLDRDRIRDWYNGYGWLGEQKVYNPFDVLLLFRRRRFGAWWFETGTPTFLVDTLLARGVGSMELDGMRASDELLGAFDVDDIAPEALLFQTGYLTILDAEDVDGELLYRLGYPNREVRQSLNRSLLNALVPASSRRLAQGDGLREMLRANDFTGAGGAAPGVLRQHPLRVAHEQRHRPVRGVLRERVLLPLRGAGARRDRRGQRQPRARRHDRSPRRRRLPVRVQGGGAGRRRRGDGAVEEKGLRRQAPRPGPAHPPGGGGVQPGDPQPGVVRGRTRLTCVARNPCRVRHAVEVAAGGPGSPAW